MKKEAAKDWFENWFDSPYYHILYAHRDYEEASAFISKLITFLQPPPDSRMLDVACGNGRHSVFLANQGFEVTGIDLSSNNISAARRYEHDKLSFFVHDMRKMFRINYFNYAFNFFTSFGYFENEKDNLSALRAISRSLTKSGIFVLDFLNAKRTIRFLNQEEVIIKEGIDFHLKRTFDSKYIHKLISFEDGGKEYNFEERVRALFLEDFSVLFNQAGLELRHVFGDYDLNAFSPIESARLILVACKT